MMSRRTTCLTFIALSSVLLAPDAHAEDVWSGTDFFFEKEDFADPDLAENQDRITDAVWITRDVNRGIYNAAQEGSYTGDSPADTEWATGNAADWQSLTFTTWFDWHGGPTNGPPSVVGVDAVVHLISEDIYIDIRFESWTQGSTGGGFSYSRASDPSPVETTSWGGIKSYDFAPPQ